MSVLGDVLLILCCSAFQVSALSPKSIHHHYRLKKILSWPWAVWNILERNSRILVHFRTSLRRESLQDKRIKGQRNKQEAFAILLDWPYLESESHQAANFTSYNTIVWQRQVKMHSLWVAGRAWCILIMSCLATTHSRFVLSKPSSLLMV